MFPFKLASIFKSRWIALFFAANILWFADDVVGSNDKSKDPVASSRDDAQLKALAVDREKRLAEVARGRRG